MSRSSANQWAVAAACAPCVSSEGWTLSEPPDEHELDTGSRMVPVHADHEDHFTVRGYQTLTGEPADPSDSGLLFICPHLDAASFAD